MSKPKSHTSNGNRRNKGSKSYSKAVVKAAIKVKNCRKHSISESDSSGDDDTSDEEAKTRKARKRVKHTTGVDEEVEDVQNNVEVIDMEELDDELDDERPRGSAQRHNKEGDLEDRHRVEIPSTLVTKKDSTRDLLTIFSDILVVKFKMANKDDVVEGFEETVYETVKGRWCLPCKTDAGFVKKNGMRKAFHIGGNSSCRTHIQQHYELYKKRCKDGNIPENHHAMPRVLWKELQEKKKGMHQGKLSAVFETVKSSVDFTREGVLHAVARFVACDDQALAVANNAAFRNCLVSMRPKAKTLDLPSTHDVAKYIHNECIAWLTELKSKITNAPGGISSTADGWTADNTKASFMGMTAHWIDVDEGKWKLRSEVIGFQGISGEHSGWNLGRYFLGMCDRVGICSTESKLYTVTLDNTSNNTTTCTTIESLHARRQYRPWSAADNQLPCLEHVVNLANVDVMGHITKIAAVENATAIWEYDPDLLNNRVLGGSLDVIAAVRTIAIKIQVSGQRIEYFEKLQSNCKFDKPLRIPLHSNVRWGTAYNMLDRAFLLRQPIDLFLKSADALYGPITTVRRNGRVEKKIPWSAFQLTDADWERVKDARDILKDSRAVQHCFSSEQLPTLWRALPVIEALQTAWEAKRDDRRFAIYEDAINEGLAKLQKYYSRFDEKPAYVLALALHPYYKLEYIKMAWGGAEEQAEEILAGNMDAKNWRDEAHKILETTMEKYYKARPGAEPAIPRPLADAGSPKPITGDSVLSDFDRFRLGRVTRDGEEGWQPELRRYLKELPADVSKDTDIVEWWQDHAKLYPTLARIALDILPCQASSVPCERLFSASKQTADDRRASLGAKRFEELQLMKFAWRGKIKDVASLNSDQIEVVEEYRAMLEYDNEAYEFEKGEDEFVINN